MDIEDNADDSQVSEQSQQIEEQIIHDLAQFQLSQPIKSQINPQSFLEQIEDVQIIDQLKGIVVKKNLEDKLQVESNETPVKVAQSIQEVHQQGTISQAIRIEEDQKILTWPQKDVTINQPKPLMIDDLLNDDIKAPIPRQIEKQEQTKNEQQIDKPFPQQVKIPFAEQALLQIQQNQIKITEQAEELHNQAKWTPLDANFSQSRSNLIFTQKYHSNEFWKGIVSNNAFNTFINLFPKPLFLGIRKLLNDQISAKFVNQQIPNGKFFSNDAIYQYLGIKILMGYNRMPSTDDYFNDKLPFRSKICELYKKGRFDFAEDQIKITDDIALRIKQTKQEFNEFQEQKTIKGEIIPYLTKKMNKLFRLACDPGQNLVILKDECFNYYDNIKEQEVILLLLIDSQKQFILTIAFSYQDNISNAIFRMVEPYKNNNHKLYLQAGLLNLDEVNQLRESYRIYASCILAKSKRDNFVFTKDLISNGNIMVLKLTNPNGEMTGAMASTADGFHRTGPNDKRSFAPQQMQRMLSGALQIISLQEKYSCNFIKQNYNQILFQKIQEIVIWNSYISYKNIQRIDPEIEFINFRIELAKGLLEKKLKDLPQTIIIPLNQRLNTVGTNTDVTGNVDVKAKENIPFSNFHIPTKLIAPQGFKIKIICLVCKKDYNTIVSCRSCSEQQKKVIAVCASECFSIFHTSLEYSRGAAEIPIMKQSAVYEQSNLAQNANYQQTFKKAQMLEQAQQKQKQQTSNRQATEKKVNNKKNQIIQNIMEDEF